MALDSLKEAVASFGLGKIVFILIVVLAVAGYVFIYPKPGVIEVSVHALDGSELPGAEVALERGDGSTAAVAYADDDGVARFTGVAPGDYSANVDPGAGYKPASKSVTLESGGEASVSASVERAALLTLTEQNAVAALPLSCQQKMLFEVRNAGASDENVELVADGLESSGVSFSTNPPGGVFVAGNGGANLIEGVFLASKGEAGDVVKGRVRPKGVRGGVDVSFTLAAASSVSVSPQSITGSAEPGGVIQEKIIVSNDGSTPVEVSEGDVRVEGFYANSYAWSYFEPRIEPGSKASWWIALRVPENAYGKLVGSIKISLPCKTVSIDVDTNVKD